MTDPLLRGLPIAFAAFVLPFDAPAAAQVVDTTRARRDTTVFRIGEIIVQAARPVATVGGSSAIEVVLDSMTLRPAPTLEEVLREVPMVHLRTNSRGETEVSVRGSESRQVAVLVDGVPITLAWDARADLSVIPATAAQQLTLVRGLSSVLYGPNVLGGVIEVGVGRGALAPRERSLQLAFGIDDIGAYSTSATAFVPIEGASGRWLVRAGAGWRSRPGQPLPSGVTEPVPGDDENLRLNTDADHADGFLALRYNANGGSWLSFSGSGFRAERGIAAELHSDEPRFWRYPEVSRLVAVASGGTGERATPLGLGDLEASFGVDLGHTDIDAFDSRAYDTLVGQEAGDDRTFTLRVLGDHTLGARGDLRAAFTYGDVNHDEIIDNAAPNAYRQRLYSLGGETAWRVPGAIGMLRGFRVSAGAALDAADTPEAGGKPTQDRISDWGARFGVSAVVNDGDALLHAGISRRARFPALRELYSGALGSFEINPDLTAERLVATEAGVTTKLGEGELQAVVFHHSLTDAVARIRTPAGKFRRINRNEIRSTGLELLAGVRLGPLSLGGDITVQSVEVIDPQAGTTVEPEHVPAVFGSLDARAPLFAEIEATLQARYTGRQFCVDPNDGGDLRLDGAGRFDVDLARGWRLGRTGPWFSRIETRVSVDNIADTAIYDQCGMPQPGRTLRFQVRLN